MNVHGENAVTALAFFGLLAVVAHSMSRCDVADKQRGQERERTRQKCLERFTPKECL